MIEVRIIDGGFSRQVTARCDRGSGIGCKSIDQSLVQRCQRNVDFSPAETDETIKSYFSALGWLQVGDKHYCSRFCADKHVYDVARATSLTPVEKLNDVSYKLPPPRGESGGKRAPIAPRVSK